MKNRQLLIDQLDQMKGRGVNNYIIHGLKSHLIDRGTVRVFSATRHPGPFGGITPHSHRYDFACLVLRGHVINTTWEQTDDEDADMYRVSLLKYDAAPGQYGQQSEQYTGRMKPEAVRHVAGEAYGQDADTIHSIKFSKDAVVLFLEGPQKRESSLIIQPVVDGELIETLRTEPWMFAEIEN